ncbi:hypothetical protein F2Q70_00043944 [Brassica cretica]|uniref:Uncharacterized protein n=1 Tax=Brassica cretica TaxID=69181 RepID=A0A8S9KIR8_BRACR|nr:hypothetical protein F2Q70_00043944 [Brassica cretica]
MKLTATNDLFASQPSLHCPCLSSSLPRRHGLHLPINLNRKNNSLSIVALSDSDPPSSTAFSRRAILLAPPFLSAAASLFLKPSLSLASEENSSATVTSPAEPATPPVVTPPPPPPTSVNKEETITSRIYDATAIGEPMAMGKDKKKYQFIEEDNRDPHEFPILLDVTGIPKADETTNNELRSSSEAKRVESGVGDDGISDWRNCRSHFRNGHYRVKQREKVEEKR